jgi:hypothetical protein
LQIFSQAPGIYIAYDYANALKFHNHMLPGKITVSENGNNVIEAQLTSIADADPSNLSLYVPTTEMTAHGPAPVSDVPERFPMFFPAANASDSNVQPTIVHVTIDPNGNVQEIEALQHTSVSDQALALMKSRRYPASPQPAGASPRLREAFVNVQFRPGLVPTALVH